MHFLTFTFYENKMNQDWFSKYEFRGQLDKGDHPINCIDSIYHYISSLQSKIICLVAVIITDIYKNK